MLWVKLHRRAQKKLAEGESPVKAGLSGAATGAKEKVNDTFGGGGSSGGSGGKKFTSIIKTIDVGVPLSVAYDQWTQFQDWTDFMKKAENVNQQSEEKVEFKGQVFLSHRTWNSTIIQQVADKNGRACVVSGNSGPGDPLAWRHVDAGRSAAHMEGTE